MAQNDPLKRYLDAGMAFTQLSREKAEEFVKDLVKQGDVRRKEAEELIETLVERSRKNTEDLVAIVRQEIADQLRNIGLEDLVKKAGLPGRGGVAGAAEKVDKAADKAAAAVAPKKPTAKKPPAKKVTAKKVATGAAPAKKAVAKKSTKKS